MAKKIVNGFRIKILENGRPAGYLRSVNVHGVISKTMYATGAKFFSTDWSAQSTVDQATMDAMKKGYMLMLEPCRR